VGDNEICTKPKKIYQKRDDRNTVQYNGGLPPQLKAVTAGARQSSTLGIRPR